MEKEIRISNNLNEIATLANFIEELGEELSLPMEAIMNINLALEEAVANIIMYAFPGGAYHSTKSDVYSQTTRFPADRQRSFL